MPSPICTVNGSATLNGVNLTPATTATIALADSAGVKQWSIVCISTDETNTTAAINATLTVNQVTKTATFTVPAAGSALIFQSKVNNGRDVNGRIDASLTTTFGVFALTGAGRRVGAFDELLEGNAAFGWVTKINAIIRDAASSAASAGLGLYPDGGALSVGAADQTIIVGGNAISVRCGDGLVANANGVSVGASGDGSIVVSGSAIGVGVLASDAQHGTRGGGTTHALATSLSPGFLSSAHFSLLDGATAAATASTVVVRTGSGGVQASEVVAGVFRSASGGFAGGISLQSMTAAQSGSASLHSGSATTSSGQVQVYSGSASGGSSGSVTVGSGDAATTPGAVAVLGGSSSGTGRGATVTLLGGGSSAGSQIGGDVVLVPGTGAGGVGSVAIGSALANFGGMKRGIYIAMATAIPSSNPVGGYYLYGNPADNKLYVRGPSGTITQLALP